MFVDDNGDFSENVEKRAVGVFFFLANKTKLVESVFVTGH